LAKYKSETFRHGEPDDHEYAVKRVCMWLSDNVVSSKGQEVVTYSTTKYFFYPDMFRTHKDYPEGHSPDITIYKRVSRYYNDIDTAVAFIEIDGRIGIQYTGLDGKKHQSTPTKHDKPAQKKNDHIFEEYVRQYHSAPVIRLLKEEILTDNEEDRNNYITKNLKRFRKK
jgi:hypothetical protein